jgi:hypothetical protein
VRKFQREFDDAHVSSPLSGSRVAAGARTPVRL